MRLEKTIGHNNGFEKYVTVPIGHNYDYTVLYGFSFRHSYGFRHNSGFLVTVAVFNGWGLYLNYVLSNLIGHNNGSPQL